MFPLWMKKTKNKYKNMPSPADQTSIKGIPRFTSRKETARISASMTVEAAFVLPLFLFFFLHLAGVMEMLRLHGGLEAALWNAGNQLTLYGETFEHQAQKLPDAAISYVLVYDEIKDFLGKEYLERSPLVHGAAGLNYLRSDYLDEEDCVDIVITYQVEPVLSVFPFRYRRMANRYYARCWTGYDAAEAEEPVKYVYVTSYGEVWHEVPDCSYIYHQVEQCLVGGIAKKKNVWGYRYDLCEFCEDESKGIYVYFTKGGEKYHYRGNCSAIYKDIRAIEWQEASSYRPCSRCVFRE